MPPVNIHQQTVYSCNEGDCKHKIRGRGVQNLKEQGYQHLIRDHATKYIDSPTFQQHYKIYFRNYYKIQ